MLARYWSATASRLLLKVSLWSSLPKQYLFRDYRAHTPLFTAVKVDVIVSIYEPLTYFIDGIDFNTLIIIEGSIPRFRDLGIIVGNASAFDL